MSPRLVQFAKWALAVVTLLLMASMGGGFLFLPLLIPAHIWAARRSGRVGRIVWLLLPAAGLAMATWALVYETVGEAQPVIWLVPLLALAFAWRIFIRSTPPLMQYD